MKIANILKVSAFTFFSRILGLIRDILLSRYLGVSIASDAFFVAFKIPNLFRKFFAEGSMQSAFIPLFSKILHENEEQAKVFSSQVFTLFFVILFVFVVFLEVFTPQAILVLSPGFAKKGAEAFNLAVSLLRVNIPYLFFISLVAFYSSILNSIGRFSVTAFVPALLNIAMIFGIYGLHEYVNPAFAVSYGVVLGGVLQLLLVFIACYWNNWLILFRITNLFPLNKFTLKFFRRLIPVVAGGGVYQLNIMIDILVASLLPMGAISYLFYADRLYQLPLAIIGIAIGSVVLPFISSKNHKDVNDVNNAKLKAILLGLGFSLPAMVGLIVFSYEIIKIIFLGGHFSLSSVHVVAYVLVIYAISLPINIVIKIILPFFYAEGNIRTPLYSTLVCLGINAILVFPLSLRFGVYGIAMATVFSSYVNFMILITLLQKKHPVSFNKGFMLDLIKLVFATILFTGALLVLKFEFLQILHVSLFYFRFIMVFMIIFTIILFLIILRLLQSSVYYELFNIIGNKEE